VSNAGIPREISTICVSDGKQHVKLYPFASNGCAQRAQLQ